MDTRTIIELFGYLGSILVVVSMLMSSVVKLRVINTIGSIISGTYALIIGSVPLALMNLSLVIINLYNLRRLLVTEQKYEVLDMGSDQTFLHYFLDHYFDDIQLYFPNFKMDMSGFDLAKIVYCEMEPAGVLLGRVNSPCEIEVILDYTTPKYRDCSVGRYLYSELSGKDINKLVLREASDRHKAYLEKMGYRKENGCYVWSQK